MRSRSSSHAAPGYYLYREQFKFDADGATLGSAAAAGRQGEVRRDLPEGRRDLSRRGPRSRCRCRRAGREFRLVVDQPGLRRRGLCYPPMQSGFEVSLAGFGGNGSARALRAGRSRRHRRRRRRGSRSGAATARRGDRTRGDAASALGDAARRPLLAIVGAFFVAGVLLSLTPCVLPMLPIVSSIIVGQGGQVVARPWACAGRRLFARHGAGLHGARRRRGPGRRRPGRGLADTLGARRLRARRWWRLSLSMFGVYELQPAGGVHRKLSPRRRSGCRPAGSPACSRWAGCRR